MHRTISSALALAIASTGYAPIAQAVGKRQIPVSVAERGMTVKLTKGVGVVLNFIPSGETITQAWLSDPSKVVLSANGGLCAVSASQSCAGGVSATVLYLKPIVPLAFSGLYQAGDGSALLTVITKGSGGDRLYQFRLVITNDTPEYTALEIGGTPSFDPLPPPFPTKTVLTPSVPPIKPEVATLPPPPEVLPTGQSPYVVTRPPEMPSPSIAPKPKQKQQRKRVARRAQAALRSKDEKVSKKSPSLVAKTPEPQINSSEQPTSVEENPPPVLPKDAGKQPVDKPVQEFQQEPEIDQPDLPQEPSLKTKSEPASDSPSTTSAKQTGSSHPKVPANVEMANAISRGLPVGVSNKQIGRWSWTYYRVQESIRMLRYGRVKSLEAAARLSGLKLAVLAQVHRWGGG
jgi:hypothetical protein